jgi:ubiquinone/menaquinone biosynthesis C-methylase UbiE
MRLSKRITERIDDGLIIKINKIYHDLENAAYQDMHTGMFRKERRRWVDYAGRYIERPEPMTCCDYGSGTGFVASAIGPFLKENDGLVCVDLSAAMLRTCGENLRRTPGIRCRTALLETDGVHLPVAAESIDAVTVNSVLHHLPHPGAFARECRRVLKKGGIVIVAHEPNADVKLPAAMKAVLELLYKICSPSSVILSAVESNGFIEAPLRRILGLVGERYRKRNKMLDDIARRLMESGDIAFRLRGTEIQQLVDIHTEKGLGRKNVLDSFSAFELLEWRTYSFFRQEAKPFPSINDFLERRFPEGGGCLSFVLKKK